MTGTTQNLDKTAASRLTRRSLLAGLTATLSAPAIAAPIGPHRTPRSVRRLSLVSIHTGERIETVYRVDDRYLAGAMAEITWIMRDWRNDKVRVIEPREIDILSEVQRKLRSSQPFELISGYRSPETNAMLRARSSGVARNSRHMFGQAADIRLRDRSLAEIARAAHLSGAGGIGTYARSDFVHIDCGPLRRWEG